MTQVYLSLRCQVISQSVGLWGRPMFSSVHLPADIDELLFSKKLSTLNYIKN